MLDPDAIYFPEAEIMPSLAMAFMRMMFAHAEFEEQVRDLHDSIMATPAKRPHFFARLLNFGGKTGGGFWNARNRPKRIAKMIKDRPGLVNDQEATQIVQISKPPSDPATGATCSRTAVDGASIPRHRRLRFVANGRENRSGPNTRKRKSSRSTGA
jgi:hypothetical protein